MNKAELVSLIASKTGDTKVKSGEFVEAFISSVTESLKAGEDITLVGFVSLSTVERNERKGRNPQTGADLTIPAHTVVKFSAGKELREAVVNTKNSTKNAKAAKATPKATPKATDKVAKATKTDAGAKTAGKAPAKANTGKGNTAKADKAPAKSKK